MGTSRECVIDTTVLQKANAPLCQSPSARSQFRTRLSLLEKIRKGTLIVLISPRLLHEYSQQVRSPRNDLIKAFFEILARRGPGGAVPNWHTPWGGSQRSKASKCRFPREDMHVLRTAVRPNRSWIVTEEDRMLRTDACIHREFSVHIVHPSKAP